jgi:hypothetical protein
MVPILNAIKHKMASAFQAADEVMRARAVGTIEYEVEELDNIFAVLVLGVFIGIPAHDPLGDLFSILGID